MVADKKARQKMSTWKEAKNLITVPKMWCDAEFWRLGKKIEMAKRQSQKCRP